MGKGCCDPGSPKPKMLVVEGGTVGVFGLEEILEDVFRLGLTKKEDLAETLLLRFTLKNYVPSSAKEQYAKALVAEYKKRYHREQGW